MACELSEPESGTVASIIDGETLKLADGRVVRLIGAKAPMPPLGFRGEDPWPLVEEAKEALTRLAGGKQIELRYGGNRTDRHGYALALVFVVDGASRIWLQKGDGGGGARPHLFLPRQPRLRERTSGERE
jgi:endonuclease YncB( thermonuclease family)